MSDIEWSWLASAYPARATGDLTISFRDHTLCFAMESFSKASKLIRIIEELRARSREECIEELVLTMSDGISKLRHPK